MEIEAPGAVQPVPAGLTPAVLVAVVCTAVISVPYWAASESAVRDAGLLTWFVPVEVVLFAGTVVAGVLSRARLLAVMGLMLLCSPVAVLGRVAIDTAADPTSHNLWPLEVALCVFVAVPAVAIGALGAWVIRRSHARDASSGGGR